MSNGDVFAQPYSARSYKRALTWGRDDGDLIVHDFVTALRVRADGTAELDDPASDPAIVRLVARGWLIIDEFGRYIRAIPRAYTPEAIGADMAALKVA